MWGKQEEAKSTGGRAPKEYIRNAAAREGSGEQRKKEYIRNAAAREGSGEQRKKE